MGNRREGKELSVCEVVEAEAVEVESSLGVAVVVAAAESSIL